MEEAEYGEGKATLSPLLQKQSQETFGTQF